MLHIDSKIKYDVENYIYLTFVRKTLDFGFLIVKRQFSEYL